MGCSTGDAGSAVRSGCRCRGSKESLVLRDFLLNIGCTGDNRPKEPMTTQFNRPVNTRYKQDRSQ
jgi:hypothetical protein